MSRLRKSIGWLSAAAVCAALAIFLRETIPPAVVFSLGAIFFLYLAIRSETVDPYSLAELKRVDDEAALHSGDSMVFCPHCSEIYSERVLVCPHCHRTVRR